MEPETIVIITGEHSSCLKETKFGGDPITECVSVHVGHPESVYVMNGRKTLYTESDMKAERLEGQKEAWELAQKIVRRPECGGYTIVDLRQAFNVTDVVPDRDVPDVCILMEPFATASSSLREVESRPKRFDIVKIPFTDGEKEAIVTRVDSDQVDLMFRGGKTTRRNIANVTSTGKTLEYGLQKWMKGEE